MTPDADDSGLAGDDRASVRIREEELPGESQLWSDFRDTRLENARADLFRLYQPLARRIAVRQFRASGAPDIELNDILQLANAGLLEALDRFSPALGVPFKFYGNRRILGSILDGLARMTEVRAQASTRNAVRQERMRSIKHEEVDGAGDVDGAMAHLGAIAGELAIGFILEDAGFLSDPNASEQETPYDSVAWRQMEHRLATELDLLPPKERTVLTYHYLGAVSFAHIAELLNLSAGRISQLHKSALATLRKRLLTAAPSAAEKAKW